MCCIYLIEPIKFIWKGSENELCHTYMHCMQGFVNITLWIKKMLSLNLSLDQRLKMLVSAITLMFHSAMYYI